jgi:hypothetical protein
MLLPITYGGGSNLKTPEALLARCPIVATTKAFRRLEVFRNMPGVIIADDRDAFVAAMRRVLAGEVATSSMQDGRLNSLLWEYTLHPIIELVHAVAINQDGLPVSDPSPPIR